METHAIHALSTERENNKCMQDISIRLETEKKADGHDSTGTM